MLTEDEWRTLNAPGPVSDREAEIEAKAWLLYLHSNDTVGEDEARRRAESWINRRDEWRAKDGKNEG
jgi:hypothetical protein